MLWQCRLQSSTLGSAYSDTTAVTSCSRIYVKSVREVVNCNKLNKVISVSSSTYTTALGIKQEVEQIRANVVYSQFLNVFFILSTFLRFLTFLFFLERFYRAMPYSAKRGIAIACRLSVCPSVRPSVTLVNCDHIGWNSSKIISPSVRLVCLFSPPCLCLTP